MGPAERATTGGKRFGGKGLPGHLVGAKRTAFKGFRRGSWVSLARKAGVSRVRNVVVTNMNKPLRNVSRRVVRRIVALMGKRRIAGEEEVKRAIQTELVFSMAGPIASRGSKIHG